MSQRTSDIISANYLDKRELSEDEKRTQEYDQLAFRLVSYGAIPLLAGYTGYSRTSALALTSVPKLMSISHVRNSPRMVLFHRHHPCSGNLHVWFRPARSTVDHQLQIKECCTYANEGDDVQDLYVLFILGDES